MRHRVAGRQFGRSANQRKALFRSLIIALFKHERIETTVAKAKEIKKIAERLVTLGRRGDLHSRRLALRKVGNEDAIVKLFDKIAPRMKEKNGGYLRIIRTRNRLGDAASMAIIEFVDYDDVKKKEKEEKEKKEKTKKKA
ncbi:MAG: 50S ribosomal protein L17 [Nitrospirota bacterium]